MADRTAGGQAVDSRSRLVKLRRLELDVRVLETQRSREELAIMEHEDEIERRKEAIVGLNEQIKDLQAKVQAAQQGQSDDG
jgi:predicted  nucleic acid-binding Zn-ribbon protein